MDAVRTALIPPFFAAAGLVVVSGMAKLRHPNPAGRALASVRLPSGSWTVRGIGLAEMAIGTWCLFAPSPAAAISLCVLYAAFAVFLAVLMGAQGASCGCLGKLETPPNVPHLALDAAAAASAAVIAFGPPPGVVAFAGSLPFGGAAFVLGTILIGYLAYLCAAYLPEVFWSYGRSAGSTRTDGARRFAVGRGSEP